MPTITLPLPPSSNHGYRIATRRSRSGKSRAWMVKADHLLAWEEEVHYYLSDWQVPEKQPLSVSIILRVPKEKRRKLDIDGMLKFLIDAVVGKRRDQYIDRLEVVKTVGDGSVDVTVEVL